MSDADQLRRLLLERSVRRGDFVLASGQRSSYYIDCRLTTMSAEGQVLIGRLGLAAIRAAYQVGGPARDGAYRRAVATLERHAPVAIIGLSEQPTLLGARVGCASFPPQDLGYLDLAALCLR